MAVRFLFLAVMIVILGFLAVKAFGGLQKCNSGLRIMLLGINLTLFGGILVLDPKTNLGGFAYLIVLLGLSISVFGLGKNEGN